MKLAPKCHPEVSFGGEPHRILNVLSLARGNPRDSLNDNLCGASSQRCRLQRLDSRSDQGIDEESGSIAAVLRYPCVDHGIEIDRCRRLLTAARNAVVRGDRGAVIGRLRVLGLFARRAVPCGEVPWSLQLDGVRCRRFDHMQSRTSIMAAIVHGCFTNQRNTIYKC